MLYTFYEYNHNVEHGKKACNLHITCKLHFKFFNWKMINMLRNMSIVMLSMTCYHSVWFAVSNVHSYVVNDLLSWCMVSSQQCILHISQEVLEGLAFFYAILNTCCKGYMYRCHPDGQNVIIMNNDIMNNDIHA